MACLSQVTGYNGVIQTSNRRDEMSITYTFPADFQIPALRNLVAIDGELTTVVVGGRRVDAVAFSNRIGGKQLIATVAGKPELEAAVAAIRQERTERQQAAELAAADLAKTPAGQRAALVRAAYNSYSPDHFPGSAKWLENKRHEDALAAFDAAHPELAAAAEEARKATQQARFDALSDFARMGG